MAVHRSNFPNIEAELFLAYVGMETDLLFNRGIDLPGFASYPLLETEKGRALLKEYFAGMIALGREKSVGIILESPTWVANRDRGSAIGYAPEKIMQLNQHAVALMSEVRSDHGDVPTVISANIGPRDDAYAPSDQMSADEAEQYHSEQISALAETDVDVVSGYTLAYSAEAIGLVRAARRFGLPVVIAFTVETNGKLPTGATLETAISEVDDGTDGYTAYFMINCAHPDHFEQVLADGPWMQRIKGIVANASRCSHAELDEAEELDDGDPDELGNQLSQIRRQFPHIRVLGGCCGTDMRHMERIAEASTAHSV
ncbi:homocysteine S-methyltransferase [Litoreibacter meonggei]|uniref:Homocysteine S-methyltransferase n=1 Tax=Litoreibacter meonggei TaxID=1049199 RepID=A0A497VM29_9RHOB|nr:homocysteine S-methyltransferase family protein [Litoreibacter meonggei]RLJ41255.1 homocysteine S-methyltransferase [Litoreibacter meonggei]